MFIVIPSTKSFGPNSPHAISCCTPIRPLHRRNESLLGKPNTLRAENWLRLNELFVDFIFENPGRNQSISFCPNKLSQGKSRAQRSEFHPESNARSATSRNNRGRYIPCHPANLAPC